MELRIVVLAKQVPDTRQVGPDAMNADGTVNRAALPAVFNPEDLNALEQALRLKDQNPGSTVTLLTMGPERAQEIVMEGVLRGADGGWLLSDRLFAGADTLATSYALATAIRHIGVPDIILCGRQAIDGDTAQVGPQVAQKLGLPQVTYVEEILSVTAANSQFPTTNGQPSGASQPQANLQPLTANSQFPTTNGQPTGASQPQANLQPLTANSHQLTVNSQQPTTNGQRPTASLLLRRVITGGVETVSVPLPVLLTVNGSAAECRPRNARLIMSRKRYRVPVLSVADICADAARCGLAGSPTKVRKIENISFQAKESMRLDGDDAGIGTLVSELREKHIIG